jgi:hydroxyacylglutathione hydrolase
VFCGDTLFAAGCGRLFEGTAEQMLTSLHKLSALPDDTNVYCAHEYTLRNLEFAELVEPGNKNIGERISRVMALRERGLPSLPSLMQDEKATNPFLRCTVPAVIASVEQYAGHSLLEEVGVFAALRKWKDEF